MEMIDMLNKLIDNFAELVTQRAIQKMEPLYQRVDALDVRIQNTLDNTAPILENMNDRMQRLEDRFDHLEDASVERIEEIIRESEHVMDYDAVDELIDEKLSWKEYIEEDDLEDKVREAISGMSITATID